jgi:hypothetical protein
MCRQLTTSVKLVETRCLSGVSGLLIRIAAGKRYVVPADKKLTAFWDWNQRVFYL